LAKWSRPLCKERARIETEVFVVLDDTGLRRPLCKERARIETC